MMGKYREAKQGDITVEDDVDSEVDHIRRRGRSAQVCPPRP